MVMPCYDIVLSDGLLPDGTRPLYEPMLTHCKLSRTKKIKNRNIFIHKIIWKCQLQNGRNFMHVSKNWSKGELFKWHGANLLQFCHISNVYQFEFIVNSSLHLGWEQNEFPIEFQLPWKNRSWNGPVDNKPIYLGINHLYIIVPP